MRLKTLLLTPSCLLGPAIWFSRSEAAGLHRKLVREAWPSKPRWQWTLLLFENLLVWYLFLVWRNLYFCLTSQASKNLDARGFSHWQQCKAMLRLGLWYGAPPSDYFLLSLHRHPSNVDWLEYVFSSEQFTWHRVHSCPLETESSQTLNDKLAFERFISAQGLNTAKTVAYIASAKELNQELIFTEEKQLFIKPQSANAMRGCFLLSDISGDWKLQGVDLDGQALAVSAENAIYSYLESLVEQTPILLQEVLENSAEMDSYIGSDTESKIKSKSENAAANANELVTVRVITGHIKGRAAKDRVTAAYINLEIESINSSANNSPKSWCVYPVDLVSGMPKHPVDMQYHPLQNDQQASAYRHFSQPIPEFEKLIQLVSVLHPLFPDIKTLAWDCCHTENGWTIIEGNVGWGLITPQQVSGIPLLESELINVYEH